MHHVDVTPSAADVARPSAPRDVTVALETRAGCLRAYHRRPGRPGDLGYPVAPTVTATPGTTLVLPAVQAEPATRSRRPPPPARGSRPPHPPSRPARSHPRHRAAGRQQADHHSWTGQGPSAAATAGRTTVTEAL